MIPKKLCMHSYDILFPLNDWSQQHAVASKVVYIKQRPWPQQQPSIHQPKPAVRAATYIQPSKASWGRHTSPPPPLLHPRISPAPVLLLRTTPLAFRNLMDNLWEKGKREKNISLCNNNEHTYYHSTTKSTTPNIYYIYIYYAHTTMYYYIYTTTTVFCNLYCLI